jgi:hypothetical protein
MTYASDVAQGAVDDAFAEFGRPASYTPAGGGAAVVCTVIVDLRGDDARPIDHRPMKGQGSIEVRKSEIVAPATSDTFVPGTIVNGAFVAGPKTYTVMNRPWVDDEEGLVWKMWAA